MPASPTIALPEGTGFGRFRQAPALPLSGVTLLAVEDSRFASEALRLLCQRSGARLRRAETLADARQHLAVYRPDVVLVDLGLPDGNGVDLIRELVKGDGGASLVLATSGDPDGWSISMRAGAAGFLEKPLESLATFQELILARLTGEAFAAAPIPNPQILPDRQALHDDLLYAVHLVENGRAAPRRYVSNFVRGLARSSQDSVLEDAALRAHISHGGMAHLGRLLQQRIAAIGNPFD